MGIAINPGSGDVKEKTSLKNAEINIKHYITDCGLKDIAYIHIKEKDEGGRYMFMLYVEYWDKSIIHWVEMPGLPLDKVRYFENEGKNIWDFPRLYIDGSSWIWCFAMLTQKDFEIINQCPECDNYLYE